MIKQAILTKCLAETVSRGARIKASCERGSITIPRDHSMGNTDSHIFAAKKLVETFCAEDEAEGFFPDGKNPWSFPFASGQLASGDYVHVFTE